MGMLTAAGLDPGAKDRFGRSLAMASASGGSSGLGCVEVLAEAGADFEEVDPCSGSTPLGVLRMRGREDWIARIQGIFLAKRKRRELGGALPATDAGSGRGRLRM